MHFEKISLRQFLTDAVNDKIIYDQDHSILLNKEKDTSTLNDLLFNVYDRIKLPSRATKYSAGYDIYSPYDFILRPGETIKLSTGIRVFLDTDKFLLCCPRSGHGFKYRIQLDNTIGIIDADYAYADNEGHIAVKLTNDGHCGGALVVRAGDAICQAIIMNYYKVDNDDDTEKSDRIGGFGSTSK